jgi:hypothetical protein
MSQSHLHYHRCAGQPGCKARLKCRAAPEQNEDGTKYCSEELDRGKWMCEECEAIRRAEDEYEEQ